MLTSQGFAENRFRLRPTDQMPTVDVLISESDVRPGPQGRADAQNANNTLAVHNCPMFEEA